jgi:hypothetical protein
MKTLREMINIVESAQQLATEAVPFIKGPPTVMAKTASNPLALNYATTINKIAQKRVKTGNQLMASRDSDEQSDGKLMIKDANKYAQIAKTFELKGMQAGAEKFFQLDDYDDLWEFLEDFGLDVSQDLMPLR